jgi:hypothetical protein
LLVVLLDELLTLLKIVEKLRVDLMQPLIGSLRLGGIQLAGIKGRGQCLSFVDQGIAALIDPANLNQQQGTVAG